MAVHPRARARIALALLCAGLAPSCHGGYPSGDPWTLGDGERSRALRVIREFWRANRLRDSVGARALTTSAQPYRYARDYWDVEGAFTDSTDFRLVDAYRAASMRGTVIVEIEMLHMRCPAVTGGGLVHWRFELLPARAWRIAGLGSDPC